MLATFANDRTLATLTAIVLALFLLAVSLIVAATPVLFAIATAALVAVVLPIAGVFALVTIGVYGCRTYARFQVRFTTAWHRQHFFLHVAYAMAWLTVGCLAVGALVALVAFAIYCPLFTGSLAAFTLVCILVRLAVEYLVSHRRTLVARTRRLVATVNARVTVARSYATAGQVADVSCASLIGVVALTAVCLSLYLAYTYPVVATGIVVALLVVRGVRKAMDTMTPRFALATVGVPTASMTSGVNLNGLLDALTPKKVADLTNYIRGRMAGLVAEQLQRGAEEFRQAVEQQLETEASDKTKVLEHVAQDEQIEDTRTNTDGFDMALEQAERAATPTTATAATTGTATLARSHIARTLRKPADRTYKVTGLFADGVMVEIAQGKVTDTYAVERFDADWGTGLCWKKIATNGQHVEQDAYDTNIGTKTIAPNCECKGFAKYGKCRHVSCSRVLLERGQI